MAYKHKALVHKKHRKARRVGIAAAVAASFLFLGIAFVSIDWLRNQVSDSNTVVSTESTTSVQSVNVSVYRSEYFQFQAPEEWRHVATESSEDRFVYVKNDDTLITQKFVIELNRPSAERETDRKVTNVAPVKVTDGRIEPVFENYISDHCINSWPDGVIRNPGRIEHDNVSFVCAPDSNQYNIAIGEDGADEDISFTTSSGEEIELSLTYSDLTAYPSAGDMFSLIKSFQVL